MRRAIAVFLMICLMIGIGQPINDKTAKAEEIANTNADIIRSRQVDEFYFDNIALVIDGTESTLSCNVKSVSTSSIVLKYINFYLYNEYDEKLCTLIGYGGITYPGRTDTIISSIDKDLRNAVRMEIEVVYKQPEYHEEEGIVAPRRVDEFYFDNIVLVTEIDESSTLTFTVKNGNEATSNLDYFKMYLMDEDGEIVLDFIVDVGTSFATEEVKNVSIRLQGSVRSAVSLKIVRVGGVVTPSPTPSPTPVYVTGGSITMGRQVGEFWLDDFQISVVNGMSTFHCKATNTSEQPVYVGGFEIVFLDAKGDFIYRTVFYIYNTLGAGEQKSVTNTLAVDMTGIDSMTIERFGWDATPTPALTPIPSDAITPSPVPTLEPTIEPTITPTSSPTPTDTPTPTTESSATTSPQPTASQNTTTPITWMTPVPQKQVLQESVPTITTLKFKLNTSGKPMLQWSKLKNVKKYIIYRSKYKNTKYSQVGTANSSATSYLDKKVAKGTTYYYRICGVNVQGVRGKVSQSVKGRIPWLRTPIIKGTKGKIGKAEYIRIRIKTYEGDYAELFLSKNGRRYKKIKLAYSRIRQCNGVFDIKYSMKGQKLKFRMRCYTRKGKKKRTSELSVPIQISV